MSFVKVKPQDAVNTIDESDLDVGSSVTIPGSVRAITPITAKELLSNVCKGRLVPSVQLTSHSGVAIS